MCKCPAHSNNQDPVTLGNVQADAAAKQAASEPQPTNPICLQLPATPSLQLAELQQRASPEEKAHGVKWDVHSNRMFGRSHKAVPAYLSICSPIMLN